MDSGVDFPGILRIHHRRFSIPSGPLAPFPQNQEIKEAFDLFDTDGSGGKLCGKQCVTWVRVSSCF